MLNRYGMGTYDSKCETGVKSRNKTSHTYNEETANEISKAVITVYYHLFTELNKKFENFSSDTD